MRKIYAPVKLEKRYQKKQISPWSSNQGIVFNLKKLTFVFKFQSMSIPATRSNRRQETVPMPLHSR